MARAEFEAFTKSLLMNYRRSPARADPPLARCLHVKKVEPGSLADRILLTRGDLLVSINGQSAGVLSPKLWRTPAKIREYIFYSPSSRERIELTAPGLDPGFELGRTPELITATYKPEGRDPEPLMELWQAASWPALLQLAGAALQTGNEDTPILPLYGAALYETGQVEEGLKAITRYLREFVRGWTVEYRGVAFFYMGLEKQKTGDLDTAAELLSQAYADVSIDRLADVVEGLGRPRPSPAILWTGNTAPGDYELETIEGARKTVTMSEALLGLGEGRVLLVCLLDGYRANGPYNQFMERYRGFVKDFKPYIGPLHVITEVKDRYPDRPYYFETEDKARAEGAPFEIVFDPEGDVGGMYSPTGSPFVMAMDSHGRILSEGEMDGMDLWRALVAANR
jgi:hypothetical protein